MGGRLCPCPGGMQAESGHSSRHASLDRVACAVPCGRTRSRGRSVQTQGVETWPNKAAWCLVETLFLERRGGKDVTIYDRVGCVQEGLIPRL
jgi:hypothetical protein